MKKIIVVGAGVAGLSAAVYALQSGFDVTVYEQHTIPGGNCTSWRRKGYLFEGAMHWLTGSSKNTALYEVWKNVGALKDDSKIHLKDSFYTYYHQGQELKLYRDVDKLKKHLLEVSPEDSEEIKQLCKDIKAFMKLDMPVMDVKGVKAKYKSKMKLWKLLSMLPLLPRMGKYDKMSVVEYVQRFKHSAIRTLLMSVVGETFTASSLFFTLACLASGDGGYVEGGSLTLAQNMAKKVVELGGKIIYSSAVEKVIIENGQAAGVMVKGQAIKGDAVIVTIDTLIAMDKLFENPLTEEWMNNMRKNTKLMANTFVSIGVEADLSHLPEALLFPLEKPLSFAGQDFDTFGFNNYACYEGYAPKGCSALTAALIGDTYEYWKAKKGSGQYKAEKEKLAEKITSLLEEKIPETVGKIAVIDIATPLTYERYCGTLHGSWMTRMEKGDKMTAYPSTSELIKNLYFAGQRIQIPGGLPVAVDTGRKAVQYLCKDFDTVFQCNI
jgi:phytoene dehydrogenase-like protein